MSWSYVGGKAIHTKWIVPQLPDPETYDCYVEVFGGAFWIYTKGLSSRINNKTIIYNDADPFIANNWWAIVERREDLIDECSKLPAHDKELYDRLAKEVNEMDWDDIRVGDIKLASQHLYLIVQRFVGIGYHLPKPSSGKWERFNRELIKKADIFDNINQVENLDFQEVIEKYDSSRTLFYVDPPYYNTETYYNHDFPTSDHLRLANCLKKIKGRFALSYYDFPELSEWFPESEYPWYRYVTRKMMQTKKGKKVTNDSVGTEVLVKNYTANEGLSEGKRKLIEF